MDKCSSRNDRKNWFLFIANVHDGVSKWGFYLGGLLILLMAFIITYDVTLRYFFNSPTQWALDLSGYFMLYSTLLSAGWILKNGDHVTVSIVTDYLSPRKKTVLSLLISIISIAVTAILTWRSTLDVWVAFANGVEIMRSFNVPRYLILMSVPVGTILLLGYFLRDFYRNWVALWRKAADT